MYSVYYTPSSGSYHPPSVLFFLVDVNGTNSCGERRLQGQGLQGEALAGHGDHFQGRQLRLFRLDAGRYTDSYIYI